MRTATRNSLFVAGVLLVVLGLCLILFQPAHAEDANTDHRVLVFLRMPPAHFTPQGSYGGNYATGAQGAKREAFARDRAHANGLTVVDRWAMPMVGLDCFVMEVPPEQSAKDAADKLSHDPGIEWAEPMQTYHGQGRTEGKASGDPLSAAQPDMREWHLDALHRIATGRNVKVAVIDSSVDARHPDLIGQVAVRQNFVTGRDDAPEIHGTGVAGIIAAAAGNGKGIVGVAPNARLMALRACWQENPTATVCDTLSLAKALYFAVEHKADVINMSLSGPSDRLLGNLIDAAQSHGITVVGAVDPAEGDGGFPASHAGVIAVIDEGDRSSDIKAFGAPGRDIPTTRPGGWSFVNGSSYAAAHVSGLFALLRERSNKAQAASALVTTGTDNIIDPCATLKRLAIQAGCPADLAAGGRP
ncbi:S8 family peptidase [Asticcacaulis solisilvae]|uniref:S8 family peptidase n=1 Tax=Asticcacaulis solisilvae TaxID=1217274 RepID=UPI003FD8778E